MDNNETSSNSSNPNPFFTRGCCEPPRIGQKNDGVFKNQCSKFDSFDWLKDLPAPSGHIPFDIVEVRFKNSRKDFFRATPDMMLNIGDLVAVEASPGHDVGIVSMAGELVRLKLHNRKIDPASDEIRKVYRRARINDVEKWIAAVELETSTMFKSREIAEQLGLVMKINDVEYQGDITKAIFYYTADERVDFRELIKVLAEEFKIRIEMRQIGARQEASRLGGIGSCGRELCCSTWMNQFHSVTTQTARIQQLSLNPQKLAGQCGKLKCCLNYEHAIYLDALKDFPDTEIVLKTKKGEATHQKTDIFSKLIWYSYINEPNNQMAIPAENVIRIIEQNHNDILPDNLEEFSNSTKLKPDFENKNQQDELSYLDQE